MTTSLLALSLNEWDPMWLFTQQAQDLTLQSKSWSVNVRGTQTLVRVAKEFDVHSFIYMSSASVTSDGRSDLGAANETYLLVLGA